MRGLLERWRATHPAHFGVDNYLRRWRLFPDRSGMDTHVGNIYLHRFEDSDQPVPHDHPYWNVSIILSGRYLEHWHDGESVIRSPGCVVFRSSRTLHWLEILGAPVWTLFFHGPRRREWGFQTSTGWIQHERYLAQTARKEHDGRR